MSDRDPPAPRGQRRLLAFFAAPVGPVVAGVTLHAVMTGGGVLRGIDLDLVGFVLLCTYLAMLLFGWPMHSILRRLRLDSWIWHAVGATAIVFIILIAAMIALFGGLTANTISAASLAGTVWEILRGFGAPFILAATIMGGGTAAIYWLIARPGQSR